MLEDSLLWELKNPEVPHISYIFGTIHLFKSEHNELIEELKVILPEVDKVYTETSLDEIPKHHHYFIPNQMTLIDLIGDKLFNKSSKVLMKSVGLDLSRHIRMLPLIIIQLVTVRMLKAEKSPSLDAMIFQMATRSEKKYGGIESVDEQMKIMADLPLSYQIRAFKKMVRNISSFRSNIDNMIKLYDKEQISQLYRSSKKDLGEIKNILLYSRNEIIADRINSWHQTEPSLFTFGAGHLAGNKGVLATLKRKGNKIKAVRVRRNKKLIA